MTGLLLTLACLALVAAPLRRQVAGPEEGELFRWSIAGAGAAVGLVFVLDTLSGIGVPWHPAIVAIVALAGGAALAAGGRHRAAPPPASPLRLDWGDGIAALVLLALALAAFHAERVNMDFIYQWGIKGWKFFLARGIDFEFLARPENRMRHVDYPLFHPTLWAVTALLGGRWAIEPMLAWTVLEALALFAATREVLLRSHLAPLVRRTTLAAVALACGAFTLGHFLIGGTDWLIALALVLAWPAFLGRAGRHSDLQLGISAALAASSKIEGIVLGALLVLAYAAHRATLRPRVLLRFGLPPLAVVTSWYLFVHSGGPSLAHHGGAAHESQLWAVLKGLALAAATPSLHGAAYALLALPLFALRRETRAMGGVIALQLVFLLYALLNSPAPTLLKVQVFVAAASERLLFQLTPAAMIGCGILLDGWLARRGTEPAP